MDSSRIFGTETEYGLYWKAAERARVSAFYNYEFFCKIAPSGKKVIMSDLSRFFLFNGGQFHLDNSSSGSMPSGLSFTSDCTPEYSTPECRSVRDVVRWEKAGEKIMVGMFDLEDNRDIINLAKHGRGTDYQGSPVSCGHHENYCIVGENKVESIFGRGSYGGARLLSFLVSRLIFHGAGWVTKDNYSSFPYEISQRSDFINKDFNSGTTAERGIVCLKDEPLAETTRYARLHLIVGDHLMSETALFLTLGATHLVLKFLQLGKFQDAPRFSDPVKALHEFSADPFLEKKMPLNEYWVYNNSSEASALEVQEYFCEKTRELLAQGRDATAEECEIVEYWSSVLERLKEDIYSLEGELDWVTKLVLLEAYLKKNRSRWTELWTKQVEISSEEGKKSVSLASRCYGIELAYHFITQDGLYNRLAKAGRIKRLITDKEIESAMYIAPKNTRAKIRSDFLRSMNGRSIKTEVVWDALKVIGDGSTVATYTLPDPFDSTSVLWQNWQEDLK